MANGNCYRVFYDDSFYPIKVTDQYGRSLEFSYDAEKRTLVSVKTAESSVISYSYTVIGVVAYLAYCTRPKRATITYDYDGLSKNLQKITDTADGSYSLQLYRSEFMQNKKSWFVAEKRDSMLGVETFSYSLESSTDRSYKGIQTVFTSADRAEILCRFNDKNRLVSYRRGGQGAAETATAYVMKDPGPAPHNDNDPDTNAPRLKPGEIVASKNLIDKRGLVVNTVYDGIDRMTARTSPEARETWSYVGSTFLVCEYVKKGPDGRMRRLVKSYDEHNNLIADRGAV